MAKSVKSSKTEKSWEIYEKAARKVIADLRKELGVAAVEGKQTLRGVSGAKWEIDAKAWVEGDTGFLVVEVRRHTKAGLPQIQLGGLAYCIKDLGGKGGVIVSPRPLQKGASVVASDANIKHLKLDPASTTERYLAEFMGRTFHGVSVVESLNVTDFSDAIVISRGQE
jgi:hypothetical protein